MNSSSKAKRYAPLTIGMHWVMLLLMVAIYATMELKGIFPKGSDARAAMAQLHYMLGLSALALVLARILVNRVTRAPQVVPDPPRWQKLSAKSMHVALYVLMIGLPVLGWLILSAKGQAIPFWGYDLPPLMGANASLGKWLKNVHEFGATAGYFLVGAHAAAALFHHYVIRDNTLARMVPGIGSPR